MAHSVRRPAPVVSYNRWYASVSSDGSAYSRMLRDAFGPEQEVGQQGFASRDEIVSLAAGIGASAGSRILDVCCGVAGPAACIATALNCTVIGMDQSTPGLQVGRHHNVRGLHLVAADAASLPFRPGSLDGVLVLDSFASLPDPQAVLQEVARVLRAGGRLGFTVETGSHLTDADLRGFQRSEVPSILAPAEWLEALDRVGLKTLRCDDRTPSAAVFARRLADGLRIYRPELIRELGQHAVDDLAPTLSAWADLLEAGRVSELALVAERPDPRGASETSSAHQPAARVSGA